MGLLAEEPVSIGKVLDASFRLYKASFRKTIGFVLVNGIIVFEDTFASARIFSIEDEVISNITANLPYIVCKILVVFFLSTVNFLAIVYGIDMVVQQIGGNFKKAFMLGLKKLGIFFLATFLFIFALFTPPALFTIPLAKLPLEVSLAIVDIYYIIISVSLAFYFFYIILENKSALQSLKSSFTLVRNNWWRTVGVFTIPLILLGIINFLFDFGISFSSGDVRTLAKAVKNLFFIFIVPYLLSLGYVQFHDLKLRNSDADLENRIAE